MFKLKYLISLQCLDQTGWSEHQSNLIIGLILIIPIDLAPSSCVSKFMLRVFEKAFQIF